MGRKSKDKNEEEHLRGIIREQRGQLKQLKKQLGRSNKQTKKAEAIANIADIEEPVDLLAENPKQIQLLCEKCKNPINIVDLVVKTLYICSNPKCRSRKTIKK